MLREERLVFSFILTLALAFFVSIGINHLTQAAHTNVPYQRNVARNPKKIWASSHEIIGSSPHFKGDPRSPYVLVEFGDYQCPPCRAVYWSAEDIPRRYAGRVKMVFRNLPLTTIHPYAMVAAVAAEAAGEQGRFWEVHDALYQKGLSYAEIESIARAQHLDMKRFDEARTGAALLAVSHDVAEAKKLGIKETPTFLLCCPNQTVINLTSVSQVADFVS